LELIQVTLSTSGAFSAETEDKLADMIDEVSFVLRNTGKPANIAKYFASL
jgi:pyruvate-formate lyase-activating enzyme